MKPSLVSARSLPEKIQDQDFAVLSRIILETTGIHIDEAKRPMIYSRFSRRLKELELDSFSDYIEILQNGNAQEIEVFTNILTTNLTYFFRESHHFEYLRDAAIPALLQRNSKSQKIRLWSSACSSGQEAYSIAMILAEYSALDSWRKRILATDIDTEMVSKCVTGIYTTESLRGLEPEHQAKWLSQTEEEDQWAISDDLKKIILARQLNLFSNWPFKSGVDVIFCRNALIYFDEAHQKKIIKKFADFQTPGAYLFLGHSESIKSSELPYKRVSNTVYQRY